MRLRPFCQIIFGNRITHVRLGHITGECIWGPCNPKLNLSFANAGEWNYPKLKSEHFRSRFYAKATFVQR